MRILFDLSQTQPIGESKFHGGGKYGIILFNTLLEISPSSISAFYDDAKYIDPELQQNCFRWNIPMYKKSEWNIFDAARDQDGILYSPIYNSWVLGFPPVDITVIQTQHGLRLLEMPDDKFRNKYHSGKQSLIRRIKLLVQHLLEKKRHAKYAETLRSFLTLPNVFNVTVSNHSKYSLLTFFPKLATSNIPVFYSPSTVNNKIIQSSNDYGKYWMILSANRWVKNGIRAMIAFDQLFSEHNEIEGKVVITGINNFDEIDVRINNKDRFILLGYINEEVLQSLYKNAYALVYPSLNEGFGYPPLEAMYYGCPVMASAIASIPEVCSDAVLYFNPYLINEIKMRILQFESERVRKDYIAKGYARFNVIEKRQKEDLYKMCNYILSFTKQ